MCRSRSARRTISGTALLCVACGGRVGAGTPTDSLGGDAGARSDGAGGADATDLETAGAAGTPYEAGNGGSTNAPDGGVACVSTGPEPVHFGASGAGPSYGLERWLDCDSTVSYEDCEHVRSPAPKDVTLMFVVDVSGSVNDVVPSTGMTRWEGTRSELRAAFEQLPASAEVGVLYYPNLPAPGPPGNAEASDDLSLCVNTDAMMVPEALTRSHRARLSESLDRVELVGASPTHSAYQVAVDVLRATPRQGDKYVVLVTDGEPTLGAGCVGSGSEGAADVKSAYVSSTLGLIEAAWSAASPEVPIGTFVIGPPGSTRYFTGEDADPWLLEAADLGGTGPLDCTFYGKNECYIDLSDPSVDLAPDLYTALRHLMGVDAACVFEIPGDGHRVGVKYRDATGNGFVLPQVKWMDCAEQGAGWFWTPDGSAVVLCDEICVVPNTFSIADVEIWYGCPERWGQVLRMSETRARIARQSTRRTVTPSPRAAGVTRRPSGKETRTGQRTRSQGRSSR